MKTRRLKKYQEKEAARIRGEYIALLPESVDSLIAENEALIKEGESIIALFQESDVRK